MRSSDQRTDCGEANETGHCRQERSRAHFFERLKCLPRTFGDFCACAFSERDERENGSALRTDERPSEETHQKNQEGANGESSKDYVAPVRRKFPMIMADVPEKHHSRSEGTVLADDGDESGRTDKNSVLLAAEQACEQYEIRSLEYEAESLTGKGPNGVAAKTSLFEFFQQSHVAQPSESRSA